MARSKKQILKDRILRKRIKKEKSRLRRRRPIKHKKMFAPVYRVRLHLEPETMKKLMQYCIDNNIKPHKAVIKLLNKFMAEHEKEFGIVGN